MVLSYLALPTLQYISPVYCTSCTLPFRCSHVLLSCMEASRKQIRYGWRENDKWAGIHSQERGSSPSSISVMSYSFTPAFQWFCFLLHASSSPAAAAFLQISLRWPHCSFCLAKLIFDNGNTHASTFNINYSLSLAVSLWWELRLRGCGRKENGNKMETRQNSHLLFRNILTTCWDCSSSATSGCLWMAPHKEKIVLIFFGCLPCVLKSC